MQNQISGTLTIPGSVTTIGESAFSYNKIETLNLGFGLKLLREFAFSNNNDSNSSSNTLKTINIDMTENEWNTNVKYENHNGDVVQSIEWYDGTPTVIYNQE